MYTFIQIMIFGVYASYAVINKQTLDYPIATIWVTAIVETLYTYYKNKRVGESNEY